MEVCIIVGPVSVRELMVVLPDFELLPKIYCWWSPRYRAITSRLCHGARKRLTLIEITHGNTIYILIAVLNLSGRLVVHRLEGSGGIYFS